MIQSYRDKRTELFAKGEFVREFHGFAKQAYKRLDILDAATRPDDLRQLPGNRLEALRGKKVANSASGSMTNTAYASSGEMTCQVRRKLKLSIITRTKQ